VKPFLSGTTHSAALLAHHGSVDSNSSSTIRRERGGPRDSRELVQMRPQHFTRESLSNKVQHRASHELTHSGALPIQQQLPPSGAGIGSVGGQPQKAGGRTLRRAATIAAATSADRRSFGSPLEERLRAESLPQQLQLQTRSLQVDRRQQQQLYKVASAKAISDGGGGKGLSGVVKRSGSDEGPTSRRGNRAFASGEWDLFQPQDQR
jgi:hypothetical protein